MKCQAQETNFISKFITLAVARSPLCVGVDPSLELLQEWGFPQDSKGVALFCNYLLEAADGQIAVIKPQIAFFEQFGPPGLAELVRLGDRVREQGSLLLIDCKRGDVGHTVSAYARAFLGSDSPFFADAITVSPYLGFGALHPILTRAIEVGAGIFVVVHSSNPEGKTLQNACLEDGGTVADGIAHEITQFNVLLGEPIGLIGAVIGATVDEQSAKTITQLPHSLFLAPGIGAQGATFSDVVRTFGPAASRVIPSVSRGILTCGPSISKLKEAIQQYRENARILLR